MVSDSSSAPKERINIVYRPATGDAREEVELPFKMLVTGDFTNKEDNRRVENRKPVNINKDNFNDVLNAHNLTVNINVPRRLSGGEEGDEMAVNLNISHIKDFEPDQIIQQVPELLKLLELRESLRALKNPLSNVPEFRKKIQTLIHADDSREKLLTELDCDQQAAEE